jgi:hypothetical protein
LLERQIIGFVEDMLVLAVHSVEEVTAKVPFAIILLQDFVSSKKLPQELKCRQVIIFCQITLHL